MSEGDAPGVPPVCCCDLDGVIWRGDEPIAGAADAVAAVRAAGARVVFVTNNSRARPTEVAAKLAAFGIDAPVADVCTSAQAAAALLRAAPAPAPGDRVFACAGDGVIEALRSAGFVPVTGADPDPERVAAIVVGWHHHFDFAELTLAADIARRGVPFVATNDDPTYPGAGGRTLPGNGALVAAVATAAGRAPVVAGKPNAAMADLVRDRVGAPVRAVVIGDRNSTDGAFAAALGWPFVLVRSGIAGSPGGEPLPTSGPALMGDDFGAVADRVTRWLTNGEALGGPGGR